MTNSMLLSFLLAGVLNYTAHAIAQDVEHPAAVVGVSVMSLENDYFKRVVAGMEFEAAKHNLKLRIQSSGLDHDRQKQQVKDFLLSEVDAIAVSPVDPRRIAAVIKETNQAGIPMFTFDVECLNKTAEVVSHIGLNNRWGGEVAGRAMIKLLGIEGGNVGILTYRQLRATQERVRGFVSVIEKHNKTASRKITIAKRIDNAPTRQNGYRDSQAMLQAVPDLRGIFAINDPAAMGAALAVRQANKSGNVRVIGFDGSKAGRFAVAKGELHGTVGYNAEEIGRRTIRNVAQTLSGKKVAARILIKSKFYGLAESKQNNEATLKTDD